MNEPMRGSRYLATLGIVAILIAAPGAVRAAGAPKPAPGAAKPVARATAKAVFAGGCFWCEEATFEGLPGVTSVVSGYAGGAEANPTYEQVSSGRTGHAESVEVTFDPAVTTYEKLLDVYWHNVDPTQPNAQFCDHGEQYRSAIFYAGDAQRRAALASKKAIEDSKVLTKPIVTQIAPLAKFWPAEEYHQDYYKKNPVEYHAYRLGCGRDRRLKELWGAKAGGH
ncbi:MAG TPA: peptide-methionine (S)-S-oxide reductase MsrA [Candidatus Eisenbacteria bacterium]|nr:peptide-methionine (S)-S-oxide reductase MsrA [Candidatus Eisenbacteria bacterium]